MSTPLILAALALGLALLPHAACAERSGAGPMRLVTDFTSATADLGWYVVNDDVMGGRSQGGFEAQNKSLLFTGNTNTDGGGFSSIRTGPLQLDLSAYEGIHVRVKADGRTYTWRLATDARYRGRPLGYWATFETRADGWTEAYLPFSRFEPKFRGMKLPGPKLDPARIRGMGLMIYDKRDGPFRLRLDSVHAYRERVPFALANLRWKQRVLVLFASTRDDSRLRRQLEDVRATQAAFDDRDMELVVVLKDSGSHAAGTLTPQEASRLRATLRVRPDAFAVLLVGKDGTTKRTADRPVPMQELYTLIDAMPMRRAEMRRQTQERRSPTR
jgi:hypothetical protein